MKIRSKLDPKVYYEHWKTPLDEDYPNHHHLSAILHGTNQIYFFFGVADKPFKKFHVMTLPERTPFRVYEEGAFDIGLLTFINKCKPQKNKKIKYTKTQPTWRFWNTPFVEEFDKGNHPLSLLCRKGKGFNIGHHVIITSNEAVEFLETRDPAPRWEYYDNITIKQLIKIYATKRFHQSHKEWFVKNRKMVSN